MKNTAKKKIVIKLGTSTLTGGTKKLNRASMLEIVRAVQRLIEKGFEVAVVSSGAIAAGRELLNYPDLPSDVSYKQMLSAVGQGKLFEIWEDLFSIYGLHIGQLLLTKADLENRERYLNARDTLLTMLDYGVVPVINENDAVAISEIKVGDNDNLAALIGVLIEADTVILLTDQKGLYTADPRHDPDARLISVVEKIDEHIISLCGGSGTSLGTGGMATKVAAAKTATDAGVKLIICEGSNPDQIPSLAQGHGVGTVFMPSVHPVESRKSWLSSATIAQGEIVVDDGARSALLKKGSSLLPRGITRVDGHFMRGATVDIKDLSGVVIARGITRYGADDLRRIQGHHSHEIESILGFMHGDEAIHRDDLVLK